MRFQRDHQNVSVRLVKHHSDNIDVSFLLLKRSSVLDTFYIFFFPLCFALCPWTFPWKAFKGAHWVLREWQAAKDSRPGGLDSISWELDTLTLRLVRWPLLLQHWTLNMTVSAHVCVNLSAYMLEQINPASRHWCFSLSLALSGHYLNKYCPHWPQIPQCICLGKETLTIPNTLFVL